mmetsp:Transcript_4359/g.6109  ORF Transcript_4359/g.6109 Transcript_4359/m.6109 type:complete len:92 (-) Transcript_4359:666-941(-)
MGRFDEIVQVNAQELKGQAKMVSEMEGVHDVYHMALTIWVLFFHVLENLCFHQSLLVISLFVSDDLQRKLFVGFVVKHFNHLPKCTLSKKT